MKNFVMCFVLFLFIGVYGQAQENDEPSMFFVIEEFVSPSDLTEFRKVQSENLDIFDKHLANLSFSAWQTDNNSFLWTVPIKSFACIDKIYETKMQNQKVLNEKGYDGAAEFRDLSKFDISVVMWNEELSFNPDMPDNDVDPKFYEWMFFYLKSGHEKEAAAIMKKYKDFYLNNEVSYQWNTYEVVLGNQIPCWIIGTSDESEIALRQNEKALQEKFGEEFNKLWIEFSQHLDKTKVIKGWYLPNWSREAKVSE